MAEGLPVTGLEDLTRHLQQLSKDLDTPLDAKLFDEVELQLTGKFFLPSKIAQGCCFPGVVPRKE